MRWSVFGRLDVLVNNAGYAEIAPFEQMADADFRAVIDTNFHGVVNLTRAAVPVMQAQRSGLIINISSSAGRVGHPGSAAYRAAKFAVGGFSEAVGKEVAPLRGSGSWPVEPGSMRTDWTSSREALPRRWSCCPTIGPDDRHENRFCERVCRAVSRGDPDRARRRRLPRSPPALERLPEHPRAGPHAVSMVEGGRRGAPQTGDSNGARAALLDRFRRLRKCRISARSDCLNLAS